MGAAAAANEGALPEPCGGRRPGAGPMGRYELVRSDDAPAVAADLEAGTAAPCDGYPKRRVPTPSPSPAPAPTRQRLVSLDVFRGITVLVRQNHSHPPSSARSLSLLFHWMAAWLAAWPIFLTGAWQYVLIIPEQIELLCLIADCCRTIESAMALVPHHTTTAANQPHMFMENRGARGGGSRSGAS
jgi:hypothetical protein